MGAAAGLELKEDYSGASASPVQVDSWAEHGESSGIEVGLQSAAGRHTEQEEQKAQEGLDRHMAVKVNMMAGIQTDLAGRAPEVLRTAVRHS